MSYEELMRKQHIFYFLSLFSLYENLKISHGKIAILKSPQKKGQAISLRIISRKIKIFPFELNCNPNLSSRIQRYRYKKKTILEVNTNHIEKYFYCSKIWHRYGMHQASANAFVPIYSCHTSVYDIRRAMGMLPLPISLETAKSNILVWTLAEHYTTINLGLLL